MNTGSLITSEIGEQYSSQEVSVFGDTEVVSFQHGPQLFRF